MAGFDQGFAFGAGQIANRQAATDALKQQQRNEVAALYLNAIQTPLPKPDDPAYKEALTKREDLMKQYVASMGPEQHASFGQRLHGLIFGEPDKAEPVHGNAPPPQVHPAPVTSAPPSNHPFAHNPAYAKIQEGLQGLGNHLKAFANPLPPQAGPDYATLAAAPTAEQRQTEAAQELEKQKEAAALKIAEARRPRGSVQQQRYDNLARSMGFTGFDDPNLSGEDADKIASRVKQESLSPKFLTDPKTGLVSRVTYDDQGQAITQPVLDANGKPFGGFKPEQVRIVNGHYHYVDTVTGQVYDVPVTTETKTIFGPNVPEAPPKSSKAPSLDATNASLQANKGKASAPSRKAARSSQAPTPPSGPGRVIGQTAGILDKSDAAQYTKVAEDANNKKQQYAQARGLLADSGRVTDLELIFAWVRSNVQGAGRLTNTEITQATKAGSYGTKIKNAFSLASTGKLDPSLENQFLSDIKRAYETSAAEAADLRGQLGGAQSSVSPPKAGQSDPDVIVVSPKDMQ